MFLIKLTVIVLNYILLFQNCGCIMGPFNPKDPNIIDEGAFSITHSFSKKVK